LIYRLHFRDILQLSHLCFITSKCLTETESIASSQLPWKNNTVSISIDAILSLLNQSELRTEYPANNPAPIQEILRNNIDVKQEDQTYFRQIRTIYQATSQEFVPGTSQDNRGCFLGNFPVVPRLNGDLLLCLDSDGSHIQSIYGVQRKRPSFQDQTISQEI
jgi:hypothetical protein